MSPSLNSLCRSKSSNWYRDRNWRSASCRTEMLIPFVKDFSIPTTNEINTWLDVVELVCSALQTWGFSNEYTSSKTVQSDRPWSLILVHSDIITSASLKLRYSLAECSTISNLNLGGFTFRSVMLHSSQDIAAWYFNYNIRSTCNFMSLSTERTIICSR